MAADHPQASRQNGRPVQIKGQQEVPVRRGGKQVRYVQPGRGAAYPVNGAVYGRNGGAYPSDAAVYAQQEGMQKRESPVIFMITAFFLSSFPYGIRTGHDLQCQLLYSSVK